MIGRRPGGDTRLATYADPTARPRAGSRAITIASLVRQPLSDTLLLISIWNRIATSSGSPTHGASERIRRRLLLSNTHIESIVTALIPQCICIHTPGSISISSSLESCTKWQLQQLHLIRCEVPSSLSKRSGRSSLTGVGIPGAPSDV